MRTAALAPTRVALNGVGSPAGAQAGGQHKGIVRVLRRSGCHGAAQLGQDFFGHETDFPVLKTNAFVKIGVHVELGHLNALGMSQQTPEQFEPNLKSVLVLPFRPQDARYRVLADHAVHHGLEPDAGQHRRIELRSQGAVGPIEGSRELHGLGHRLERLQISRGPRRLMRGFRQLVEFLGRLGHQAHGLGQPIIDFALGQGFTRRRQDGWA